MLPASACSAFTAPVGRNGTFPRSAAAWRHLSAWRLTQMLSPATKTRRASFVQCGQDVMQAWEALSPFVYYGHIKDCNAAGQILPPGDGIGALRQYLPLLAAKAGDTVLTLEPHLADFVGLGRAGWIGGGRRPQCRRAGHALSG